MFYDVIKKELIGGDIFYKEVEFRDENNETHQGVNTYFLSRCDDDTLRALNVARVVESDPIKIDDRYKEVIRNERYAESSNTYHIDYELRDVSLDRAKALKLEELTELKNIKLASFEFNGNIFQLDGDSKVNINGKISQILLSVSSDIPIEHINWINKDNRVVSFSKDEFIAFGNTAANHSESVLFKHDGLRARVNNANNLNEIKEVQWVD